MSALSREGQLEELGETIAHLQHPPLFPFLSRGAQIHKYDIFKIAIRKTIGGLCRELISHPLGSEQL